MRTMIEHPVISRMERYGYTDESMEYEADEDQQYEEKREGEMFAEE